MYGKEFLAGYEAQFKRLEQDKHMVEKWVTDFTFSAEAIRNGLIQLKLKLRKLLDGIEKSLRVLDIEEVKYIPTVDSIKANIKNQYEELKEAISVENINYIVEQGHFIKSEDSINLLNSVIKELMNSKNLDNLIELLEDFSMKYKVCDNQDIALVDNRFVYGTCNPKNYRAILCRFDINTKRLTSTVTVPKYATTIQMKDRVFISGGIEPYVNTLSEFIERTKSLVNRKPMKLARCNHSACAISRNSFAVIGGHNSGTLTCCEEYLILKNK
jgi:hypothetical protein